MVKHFNILMAALISGIVALFTSILGVSGTVIGSVISSFLYQLLSSYSEQKYEERQDGISIPKPDLAGEIVYVFPLVVIVLIELLYCLTAVHYGFTEIFNFLEAATANNLFRVMGLGLILLSIYPFLKSNTINKNNGTIVFIIGILIFLRGIADLNDIFAWLYSKIFYRFDLLLAVIAIIALAFVIINILRNSVGEYEEFENWNKPKVARRVNTPHDFHQHDEFNNNPINQNNHDSGYNLNNLDEFDHVGEDNSYFDEELPIYEEDYIYVENPNNPNQPIRKKILKKINSKPGDEIIYYENASNPKVEEQSSHEKLFNNDDYEGINYSSRKGFKK